MVTEFEAQILSLPIEKQRLAALAEEVAPLLAEMTMPKDLKNEVVQRARRIVLLESFCSNWDVTKLWVSALIDRYEELDKVGAGNNIRAWLTEMMSQADDKNRGHTSPRGDNDAYPLFRPV